MRYFKYVLVIFFTLTLVGCGSSENETTLVKLAQPDNLTFNGVLTWNPVEFAISYDVYIDGRIVNVDDNSYVIEEEGDFDIYVIAKAEGYIESDPSDTLVITINYENSLIFNINVENNQISWDSHNDVQAYNLFINGVKYVVDDNIFNIGNFESGILSISVQAVYPIGVSNVSDLYYYEHNLDESKTMSFNYSMYSTIDIIIWDDIELNQAYIMDLDSNFIDKDLVLGVSDGQFKIKRTYLENINMGVLSFYLIHGACKILVEITIGDQTYPYLISSNTITVDGSKDIQFQFDLFDGHISSVKGNEDEVVLYEINNDILLIKKDFINQKFESQDSFIFSCALEKEELTVIEYFFISKQS